MPVFNPNLMTIVAGASSATGPVVSFSNTNGVTFGITGNTITASVVQGAANAITAISAAGSNLTGPGITFSNANGVSFGASAGTVTASIAAQSALAITMFSQWAGFETNYRVTAGVMSMQKVSMPLGNSGSFGVWLMDLAAPSNSSGAFSISFGAYSISQLTASAVVTTWGGFTWSSGSATSAQSLYGGVSGTRYRTFPWPVTLPPGDYVFAFAMSMATQVTARAFGRHGVNIVGTFAGVETNYFLDGVSAATVLALPVAIVATDAGYVRTGLSAAQQPGVVLVGSH